MSLHIEGFVEELIDASREYIRSPAERRCFYLSIIRALDRADYCNFYEQVGRDPVFDGVMKEFDGD